ncbi:hypothetical protein HOY80DRAFT_997001 [Tuber brumale]|nr:hypothetical protein HOY80DRAFT_997001 [Tuber brumale]
MSIPAMRGYDGFADHLPDCSRVAYIAQQMILVPGNTSPEAGVVIWYGHSDVCDHRIHPQYLPIDTHHGSSGRLQESPKSHNLKIAMWHESAWRWSTEGILYSTTVQSQPPPSMALILGWDLETVGTQGYAPKQGLQTPLPPETPTSFAPTTQTGQDTTAQTTNMQSVNMGRSNSNANIMGSFDNLVYNSDKDGLFLCWLSPLEPNNRHQGRHSDRFDGVGDSRWETSEFGEFRELEGEDVLLDDR